MLPPTTRYARSGDLYIAYQSIGDGPLDLVLIDQWSSNIEAGWDFPPIARLLSRLSTFARVIIFDKRGVGLSDPVAIDALPTLEEWIDDLRAVLDATGSSQPALMAGVGGTFMALVFAATYPERTSGLVLVDPFTRLAAAPDYPIGLARDRLDSDLDRLAEVWGVTGSMTFLAPDLIDEHPLAEQFNRYERMSASPGAARAMIAMIYDSDVRHVLPAIRVPTLVIQHRDATRITPAHGRYVADRIAGARYLEVPGTENYVWAGDWETVVDEAQEFLTGARPTAESDRVLATVLFTDIVDSTRRAAEIGDARWRTVLAEHDRVVRRSIERFRGREIKTTGDGFLAVFDGPTRGARAAIAIRDAVGSLGLELRLGLHTGEIELAGDDIAGVAVHIAARIAALAGPAQILASSTVKDLVAGSGLHFDEAGSHDLKGIPGEWRLFAVTG